MFHLDFHRKIRSGFLSIAKDNPERCRIIKANDKIENVSRSILNVIENKFISASAHIENIDEKAKNFPIVTEVEKEKELTDKGYCEEALLENDKAVEYIKKRNKNKKHYQEMFEVFRINRMKMIVIFFTF